MKRNLPLRLVSLFVLATVFSLMTWARAGGAGGGHGGGGGGYSGGHSSGGYGGGYHSSSTYYGSDTSSSGGGADIEMFLTIFAILFVVMYYYIQAGKKRSRVDDANFIDQIQQIPGMSPEDIISFKQKVKFAFLAIQRSWSDQRVDLMRRFITDGVYQRFNAQFTMMKKLEQTDVMENVQVSNIRLISYREDGPYEVLDVQVFAGAEDQFTSPKYPLLNSPGGYEAFSEFWTFIRRKNHANKDIFNSENCPKCAAPVQGKLIESARCPYCGTYINNGEYDWVLAEITQEDDYSPMIRAEEKEYLDTEKVLLQKLPDYSKQLVEDRASNAFMQILIAIAEKEEAPLRRFSTDEAFAVFKEFMQSSPFLYDRLFLNSVDLISHSLTDDVCQIVLGIKYSFRRVAIENNQARLLDEEIASEYKSMIMTRKLTGISTKGSIYANSCSNCGAPQKDTLSSVCSYCNSPFNDFSREWIVSSLIE